MTLGVPTARVVRFADHPGMSRGIDEPVGVFALGKRPELDGLGPTGKRVGQAPEAQEASGPGQKKAPRPGISVHEILYGQPQIGNPLHFVDKDQAVVADEPHRILYGCCPGHRVVKEARYAVGSLPEDDLGERALANLPRTVDYDHSGVG
jgi:hypothetical protein